MAPTWPDMNGVWIPSNIHSIGGREFAGLSFLTDHPIVLHFIHRNLAYVLTILVFIWWWKARKTEGKSLFRQTRILPLLMVIIQVVLGIYAVLFSYFQNSFLWLAIAHQFVAMLLLLSLVWMIYIVRSKASY